MESSNLIILSSIIYYILSSFILFNIFRKAKSNKIISFIPIIRIFKLFSMLDLKWYNFFGLLIPIANIFTWVYLNIKLGKKFNKSNKFIVGLIFLPIIFYIILGLNSDKYKSKNTYENNKLEFCNTLSVLTIFFITSVISIPVIFNNITKGLDLSGGFEILYQIKSADGKKVTSAQVQDTYRTMQRRIDKLGVSEPEIIIEGEDKIRVKLAGIKNSDQARNYITVAGELSFRDSSDNKLMDKSVLKQGSAAKVSQDENGNPAILLNIADKTKFYNSTQKISQTDDQLIVIWLDYDKDEGDSYLASKDTCGDFKDLNEAKCLSAATVKEAFSSNVIIQGNFSEENAKDLVDLINSGSTNVKFKEISSKTVGASFGEGSLEKTELASIIGLSLVIIFLIFMYRFSGLIASVSLLIYTACTLLIFYLIDGVLTLPGIAAMVLGIGMAVDANVITCERIKEELRNKKSLKVAYKNGNKNSFSAILDSNVTTFIIAVILFAFGESSVKGFATMLIINIIMTMLIIIVITRLITKFFVESKIFDNKLKLFINLKAKEKKIGSNFSFANNFKKFFTVAILTIFTGVVFALTTGFNFGIDFSGGSNITISTNKTLNKKVIKDDIKTLKLDYLSYEKDSNNKDYYITVNDILDKNDIKKVNKYFEKKYNATSEISVVSNLVKKDLIKNALFSLLFAVIGIVIYISIRFTKNFAISAVLALCNDVLVIFAMFAIFKFEINSIFIAAVLTIIGYSINDTIVIFDRIRENINKNKTEKITKDYLAKIVDDSVKSTLFRSINTTITTLLPIICLMIFGAKEIITFDIAIFIGLLAGTYSSVLLSSQIWSKIEYKFTRKNKKEKVKVNKKPKKKKLEELTIKGINA